MIRLVVLGAGILTCIVAAASQRLPDDIGGMSDGRTMAYVAWTVAAGGLYALAVAIVLRTHAPAMQHSRRTLAVVLLLAAAMRLAVFLPPPLLSTDIYRYVWDGRVQAAGVNPYLHLPAAPELLALRDAGSGPAAIYPNINRAYYAPTIYPPFAQAIFATVALAWPGGSATSVWGMKTAMLSFDALAVAAGLLLLRTAGLPVARVLIYAWNPLVVWEFAGGAHIDAAAAGLSALAIVAAVRCRPALAGAALGLAVLCKLLPAALFPALWRRWNLRTSLVCGAVTAAGYACYAGAGWRVLGYLPGYASEEGLESGGGVLLLRLAALSGPLPFWAGPAYDALGLAVLLTFSVFVVWRALPADPARRATHICRDALWLGAATMAVLSPHYPWYLTALALPAVLAPRPAALWLMLSAPVLYLDPDHHRVLWPSLVFLPSFALLAFDLPQRPLLPQPASQGGHPCPPH